MDNQENDDDPDEPKMPRRHERRQLGQSQAIDDDKRGRPDPLRRRRRREKNDRTPQKRSPEPYIGGHAEQEQCRAAIGPKPEPDGENMTSEDERKAKEERENRPNQGSPIIPPEMK
jgi:hypothetical protein